MKPILLITILFSFISCGQILQPDVVYSTENYFDKTNPYFDNYYDQFIDDYYNETGKTLSKSVPINFTEEIYFKENPSTIGVCFLTPHNDKGLEVLIKKSYWETLEPHCQKHLIYHELGHCLIDQDHRDDHPSIMNSHNGSCNIMLNHEEEMISELMHSTQDKINYLLSLFN